MKCPTCDGCGKVANTRRGEPWTEWTSLPLLSSAAVLSGIVRPVSCVRCGGSGRIGDWDPADTPPLFDPGPECGFDS